MYLAGGMDADKEVSHNMQGDVPEVGLPCIYFASVTYFVSEEEKKCKYHYRGEEFLLFNKLFLSPSMDLSISFE